MKLIPPRFQITISVLLLSFAAVLFSQQTVSAAFEAGVDAYKRGDYATALKEFRPLAEEGYDRAQHALGIMYEKGQGGSSRLQRVNGDGPVRQEMKRVRLLVGAAGGYAYSVRAAASRPATDYTARVIPHCDGVTVPLEATHILWQR